MADPFKLEQPFVLSFSGGRTSGYLLRRVLDAHGGHMPSESCVIFCNTGRERPQTLAFVERCSLEWDVDVVWLEYSRTSPHKFRRVNYASASTKGEPFTELILAKMLLPNVVMRFCTQWMKIKPSNRYVRHELGWTKKTGGYHNAIGLRADEMHRVARLKGNPKSTPGEEPVAPLAQAGVKLNEVMDFWARNSFDLGLLPHEGNCDLCFLKGQQKLLAIMKQHPELAQWWMEMETLFAGKTDKFEAARFRKNMPSYKATLELAQSQDLFDVNDDNHTDCRCTD